MGLSYEDIETLRRRVAIGMTGDQVDRALGEPRKSKMGFPVWEIVYHTSEWQLTVFLDADQDKVVDIQVRPLTEEEREDWQYQHQVQTDPNSESNQWRRKEQQGRKEINRRLRNTPYLRRREAAQHSDLFNDANDHNPTVLQECPECHGLGQFSRWETIKAGDKFQLPPQTLSMSSHPGQMPEETAIHYQVVCSTCFGLETTGVPEPYFTNNSEPMEAVVYANGRAVCPTCGDRFKRENSYEWTGRRHKRCGQKLYFRPATAQEEEEAIPKSPWGDLACQNCGKLLRTWVDTKYNRCGYCRHPLPENAVVN